MEPIPVKPGQFQKEDYEYIREGTCTCNILAVVETLSGKQYITVTERRRKQEFAQIIAKIAEKWSGRSE